MVREATACGDTRSSEGRLILHSVMSVKAYSNLPLATRAQLTLVLGVTLLSFVLDPSYLVLDLRRTVLGLQVGATGSVMERDKDIRVYIYQSKLI